MPSVIGKTVAEARSDVLSRIGVIPLWSPASSTVTLAQLRARALASVGIFKEFTPATDTTTVEQATDRVKALLADLDDGQSNPLLDAEILAALNSARRQLVREYPWISTGLTIGAELDDTADTLVLDAEAVVTRAARNVAMAGSRPAAAGLDKLHDAYMAGIARLANDRILSGEITEHVNGARRALEVEFPWLMDGLGALTDLAAEGDACVIDAEMTVRLTAARLATAKNLPAADQLFKQFMEYAAGRQRFASDSVTKTQVLSLLNAAQAQLIVEHDWLRQNRSATIPVYGGQRFADLPADARHGQITGAWWVVGTQRYPLEAGIDRSLPMVPADYPTNYDLAPSIGVTQVTVGAGGTGYTGASTVALANGTRDDDGHAPTFTLTVAGGIITACTVTDSGSAWTVAPDLTPSVGTGATLTAVLGPVQVVELWPTPSSGSLVITYRAGATPLTVETDRLSVDNEAVVGRAAWLLAVIRALKCTDDLRKAHNSYLASARTQQKVGATASLSGWRKGA
jgi:hypothetical protein